MWLHERRISHPFLFFFCCFFICFFPILESGSAIAASDKSGVTVAKAARSASICMQTRAHTHTAHAHTANLSAFYFYTLWTIDSFAEANEFHLLLRAKTLDLAALFGPEEVRRAETILDEVHQERGT